MPEAPPRWKPLLTPALLIAVLLAALLTVGLWTPDLASAEANNPPLIGGDPSVTITVAENTTGKIGGAFTATDKDADDTITWSVTGSAAFTISRGQLSLASGATLDYETQSAYSLTVTASDGNGGTDSVAVKVAVTDVKEPPAAPPAPPPAATNNAPVIGALPTDLTIAEYTTGNVGSAFTATDGDGDAISWGVGGTAGHKFNISSAGQLSVGVATGFSYEWAPTRSLTVTASDGTDSDSVAVTVTVTEVEEPPDLPSASSAHDPPVIGGADTATITVAENTTGNIGGAFSATDQNGDTITWSVGGTDDTSFDISGGQLSLASGVTLDYETKTSYSITVIASDGTSSDDDSVAVTVTVTDDDTEAPGKPDTPTVAAWSTTKLRVTWTAPANSGPAITDYDVQYREKNTTPLATWASHDHTGIATLLSTITGLTTDTEYEVQVRATNGEGTGAWSDSATERRSTLRRSSLAKEMLSLTRTRSSQS